MNLPTYDQIKTMINLETAQPVSTEQWKMRIFYATIDTVKMMNGLNIVNSSKAVELEDLYGYGNEMNKEETKKEAGDGIRDHDTGIIH